MAPISRNSGGIGGGLIAGSWGEASLARALFAYLSSGENQLSFHEGDLIALMGKCTAADISLCLEKRSLIKFYREN